MNSLFSLPTLPTLPSVSWYAHDITHDSFNLVTTYGVCLDITRAPDEGRAPSAKSPKHNDTIVIRLITSNSL